MKPGYTSLPTRARVEDFRAFEGLGDLGLRASVLDIGLIIKGISHVGCGERILIAFDICRDAAAGAGFPIIFKGHHEVEV